MASNANSQYTNDQAAELDRLLSQGREARSLFPELYRCHLERVYRYLYFRTGERQAAEDLTSQVFLAALEGLAGYRHRGSFAAWVFGIARRKAADHYRQRGTQVSLEALAERLASGEDGPQAQAEASEQQARLARLVSELKADEQELLRLRYAAGLSFEQAAALLGRRPQAVKMQLYRLLEKLARSWERLEG